MEKNLQQMEMRQQYRHRWHTELMETPAEDPIYCCFACLCGPCASYMLRKRALYDDMSRYKCCAGYMPCSGRCGESACPEVCLCTEVLCCFPNSVASTRFLLQDEFSIQTSQCDNCIIAFMVCLQQLACLCSIIAAIAGNSEITEVSHMLRCVSEMVMCAVCPCMQTQHKIEMDKRDGKFGARSMMEVPPVQQMSRLDQPIPPEAGYPPPPAYGQPLSYPPPSQADGYPPPSQAQSYPPANYPPPSQAQSYPPANYPPPSQAQTYPSANYPPPGTGYPPPNYHK